MHGHASRLGIAAGAVGKRESTVEGLDVIVDITETLAGHRVFVTGHTGFKGSWLALWLSELGAEVHGFALEPPTEPSLFEVAQVSGILAAHTLSDVRDPDAVQRAVAAAEPDVVFHLAAQSLVRESYLDPRGTVDTNVLGTVNVLEAVRALRRPCAVVVVTSDKCYENHDWVWGYRENDRIGGHDPYSMSKGAAELVVTSWRRSFFAPERIAEHGVCLASARAGNVIGGGDWQRDRIMADCVTALESGTPIRVRNPASTRPWQHVLEPLSGYLLLAARMLAGRPEEVAGFADAWNFGPAMADVWPVRRLADEVIRHWGAGSWNDVSNPHEPHEARLLALNCDKAHQALAWRPTWDATRAVAETITWHKARLAGEAMREVTLAQIRRFVAEARERWSEAGR
ncbi:MAG: CDP-glucose 4,6-dehydratase [Gemmatimonadales bacterium]|nr:CDP-glucose 4,6-dehydratase [Gemmatimonadales bacterium]